jgi:hypothetical protein
MALHKLTPRYLNSDDDVRLVKSTEMTDALNVRISSDDEGDAFVIKNAYGNDEITLDTALPAGTNKVIGSVANDQKNSIFYFVWNSNSDHTIYRYSATRGTAYQVYKDSVLGFTENTFVKANIVTSLDGDELVYFSAADSSPKKINASKALRNGYPAQFTSGTDEEKLLYLTTAKQPPLDPPTYNIVNNGDLKENRISDKVFQFAYRYIYQDGEISALSPYSSLTTSVAQLRDGFNTQEAKDFYNQINVFVKNTVADVDKIQVFAREGNDGTFYEISEINNSFNTNAVTVRFSNQFKGTPLSTIDKNKLFDNVPQLADSQEIVDGRLMYGGYSEGYPNFLDVNDVALVPNYKDTETIYDITLTASSIGTSLGKTILDFNNLDDFPTSFTEESTIYLNVNFSGDAVTFNGGSGTNDPLSFSGVEVVITDLDGSNAKRIALSETDDPVSFVPSGIFISETISIPSGTTKSGAMDAIRSRLTSKKYNLMLAPTRDQNVVFATSGSSLTDFTAQVSGRAIIEPKSSSFYEIELDVSELEMYIGGVSTPVNNQNLLKAILTGNQDVILKNVAAEGGFKDAAAVFFEGGKERSVVSAGIVSVTQSDGLNYEFAQASVIGTSFTSASVDSSDKSFKSGSSHKMGIVYYDSRNRSGGVQELGDVYVNSLNNRADENDLYGAASIVMRLPDEAPDWASRWAPVYQGRGSSRLKIMYSVDGAFIPYRTNSSLRNSTNNNRIYLSLNSVFKRSTGYNDAAGADLKYVFEKGDRLRIVDYDGGNKLSDEFVVMGYETLGQDDDNPILDTSAERTVERTTGNFLVIEEKPGVSGFTSTSIINRNTNWNKRCVIEIYNSEIDDSEIYYEIGKLYPVLSGVHSDERDATTLDLTVSTSSGGVLSGTSEYKLFKGDILTVGSNTITITNSYVRQGVNYFFASDKSASPLTVGAYTDATVDNPEKVIDVKLGDVYFRRRSLFTSIANEKLITGQKSNIPTIGIVRYIEDYSVSDFFTSNSSSIGRPLAPIPDAKTVKRSGSITYSEPYLHEGTFNGLSSFNLSLSNFMDLDYEYGSVKGLEGYNQRLYFIQENRTGVIAVNRNVIQASSGDNLVALSNNVLQSEQYYVGEYGTSHSESVSSRDGMVYFADVKKGRVLRIDSQGITIISDANMSSYFEDKFGVITKYSPTKVVGGIDIDNNDYIVSSDTITKAEVVVSTNASPSVQYTYSAQLDNSGTKVLAPVTVNDVAVFSFNTEERTFNSVCDEFQDSLQAIVYMDDIADGGAIFIDSAETETATRYGIATNSDFNFFAAITVNTDEQTFVFDNDYCTSDDTGTITSDAVALAAFTIAYGTNDKAWTTRYSFTPESIVSLNSDMYTFKSGKIYKHSEDADRNTYYGGAVAESIVESVSNRAPSAIKSFESLSLEGDATWQVVATTTNQTATLAGTVYDPDTAPSGVWTEKEGFYYASIHGDTISHGSSITSVTSTSEIFALGNVASDVVGGNSITFDSAINTMSFPLGSTATVYKLNGSQLDSLSVYPLSITAEKTLTLSGNVTVSDGDLLVVVGNSSIEGDQIRDYYIQLKLTKTTSSPIELYAINTVFADSKLHN